MNTDTSSMFSYCVLFELKSPVRYDKDFYDWINSGQCDIADNVTVISPVLSCLFTQSIKKEIPEQVVRH